MLGLQRRISTLHCFSACNTVPDRSDLRTLKNGELAIDLLRTKDRTPLRFPQHKVRRILTLCPGSFRQSQRVSVQHSNTCRQRPHAAESSVAWGPKVAEPVVTSRALPGGEGRERRSR